MDNIKSNDEINEFVALFSLCSSKIIKNVSTDMRSSTMGGYLFPTSYNDKQLFNSYVCSPYTSLISYSLQEVYLLKNRFLRMALKTTIPIYSLFLKVAKVDYIIFVNNWLLSTNLYPKDWSGIGVDTFIKNAIRMNNDKAIAFRSLNSFSNMKLIKSLIDQGFVLVPSRQVYIYDNKSSNTLNHNNTKIDLKLLKNTTYEILTNAQINETHIDRIVELYNKLYIDKYSIYNPQFTANFIRYTLRSNVFDLEVFVNKDGQIDAVGGRFIIDDTITLPIVGYDTSKPTSLGLYRLVLASTQKYAIDNDLVFNASSGASKFKLLRGATAYIEYTAIYIKHLSLFRQLPWIISTSFLNRVIVPLMKKYKL